MTAPPTSAISDDESLMLAQIERFAEATLAPRAAELDAEEIFAVVHLSAMPEMGIMGMNLPEAVGGIGLSGPALYRAIEAITGACGSTASMLTAHFLATDAILVGGDEGQRSRHLPAAASGEALGAFALTEPQAGSNPADMRSSAVREGDGYRLQGTKCFISNAGAASFIVLFAKTDPSAGAGGVSAFVVERARPRASRSRRTNTRWACAADTFSG